MAASKCYKISTIRYRPEAFLVLDINKFVTRYLERYLDLWSNNG